MHPFVRPRLRGTSRGLWAWVRVVIGAAILGFLVWRLGTGAFLEPLQRIDARSLVIAAGIAVPTTVCCAWRWRLVSAGLGVDLPLRAAVGAYYRSQFLNTVLPGGVLGDVNRAVQHGRDVGDVGHGLRAVVWERTAGQVIQLAATLALLLVLPSPVRSVMPVVAGAVVAALGCLVLLGRSVPTRHPGRLGRFARALRSDVREGLLARSVWPGVVLASLLVVVGHTATFLVAARTAGSTASPVQMLPLALLVLAAMGVPTNIAGWGPREGAAAWVFALAGLGAAQGIATAVVYGAMAFVATLPGCVLLLSPSLRRRSRRGEPRQEVVTGPADTRQHPATGHDRVAAG